MRWFLAGYAAGPFLFGLVYALTKGRYVSDLLGLLLYLLAALPASPMGLLTMLIGFGPGEGPWDVRLMFTGLTAVLAILAIAGLRLEKRNRRTNPVLDSSDGTPRVPTARVVTGQRVYFFPAITWNRLIGRLATVTWNRFTGRILLAIAGAGFGCLGSFGMYLMLLWVQGKR